jgi:hypothetical protein
MEVEMNIYNSETNEIYRLWSKDLGYYMTSNNNKYGVFTKYENAEKAKIYYRNRNLRNDLEIHKFRLDKENENEQKR